LNNIIISIVTVVLNQRELLSKTLSSVLSQSYKEIEYIIIDGGSIDGTLELIKEKQDKLKYWVSEIDNGLYHAMNKGIKKANGDFICFINAGDIITHESVLESVINRMENENCLYFTSVKIIGKGICWYYPDNGIQDISNWLKYNLPNHQTMFFPKTFYKNNLFDLRLKLRADDDYKMRAINSLETMYINENFINFKRDGLSSNHREFSLLIQRINESFLINYKHNNIIKLIIDPLKLLLFFTFNNIFGEKAFDNLIKNIVRFKSRC